MKTIYAARFLVFSISWIIVCNVCATEEAEQLPTTDSKQLSLINGSNDDSTQIPPILDETTADSEQLPPLLSGSNDDSKQLPLIEDETNADSNQLPLPSTGSKDDSTQLPPFLTGSNDDSNQLPPILDETNDDSNQLPPILDGTNANRKVIGGTSADRIDFAYVTQVFNKKALCGGTIVTARSILTASHCFIKNTDPQFIVIAVGNTGKSVLDPQALKLPIWDLALHEEFDKNGFLVNDIALLFLDTPITLGRAVSRALLVDSDGFLNATATEFLFAGWGTTTYPPRVMSQYGLQQISFQLIPKKECEKLHNATLFNEVFCLYKGEGQDTCIGDSGGGVKWNGVIVGVVSCGDGCGALDLPGLYTNVFDYLSWIEDRLQDISVRMCEHKNVAGRPKFA